MTTLTVYDSPMCCPTGVCGPEVDSALAQFAGDLDWLKTQGIEVRRFNFAQEPTRFVENAAVKAILDRSDGDELPAIVVGDTVVASGRYPRRDELSTLVNIKNAVAPVEMTGQIKELIALGAAIGASCEPCFKWHYEHARKQGVSLAAIRAAVRIGEAVKAASARNILGLADRILAEDKSEATSSSCCGASTRTPERGTQTKRCG